jgi:hypothetical protein
MQQEQGGHGEPCASLEKGWRNTCRVLFGEEIGALDGFAEYLGQATVGRWVRSASTGKRLWVGSAHHCEDAKFIEFGAAAAGQAASLSSPPDINSIKDIDSLLEAVRERIVYSGNTVLGSSRFVEDSDSVTDSTFILNSSMIVGSKCLAWTCLMQHSEYAFGCASSGQSSSLIRCFYNNSINRCFEMCACVGASDSSFCYNTWGCSDCMFSFNLRSKRHVIANVQLEKGRYDGLKKKLVGEIAAELGKRRGFRFSVMDMVNGVDA